MPKFYKTGEASTTSLIDHHLLAIHNVKEVADPFAWNIGFLAVGGVGLVMLAWLLMRAGWRKVA